ncbi:hypothetical protein L2E82_18169 [Cichorium intybus]|uniref:Uncharacterized protein n=1 Tax=Cichorium intybus TaxID=13427 RepID=A0ACB9F8X7_CICIN|nr:hypothetical protein L2E82_18169 [Cichorium intybus]
MSSQTYVDDHLMCAIVGNGFILIFFCISNGFPNPNPSKTDLPSPSQTLDLGAAINLGFDSTASGHRLRISSLSHDLLSSISQLLRRKNVHHTQVEVSSNIMLHVALLDIDTQSKPSPLLVAITAIEAIYEHKCSAHCNRRPLRVN